MGQDNEVQIEPALAATDEVRSLVGELEAVLSAEYSPEQRPGSRSTWSSTQMPSASR